MGKRYLNIFIVKNRGFGYATHGHPSNLREIPRGKEFRAAPPTVDDNPQQVPATSARSAIWNFSY